MAEELDGTEADTVALLLHGTTDAEVWADEFVRAFNVRTVRHADGEEVDVRELMVGWFANAIETGRGAGVAAAQEIDSEVDPAGDARGLLDLKRDRDPRGLAQMVEEDEFDDVTVEKVDWAKKPNADGTRDAWVSWHHGLTSAFAVPKGVSVREGDTLRIYGNATLGGRRHGWAINGRLIEWRTPWERFAERMVMLARMDRDRRKEFDERRDELDAMYEALPPVLRRRIDRFRREKEDFRVQSEFYELLVLVDAPKIARAVAAQENWTLDEDCRVPPDVPASAVKAVMAAWRDLSYEEERRLVPDMGDGHSGFSHGAAVAMAEGLLSGEVAELEDRMAAGVCREVR